MNATALANNNPNKMHSFAPSCSTILMSTFGGALIGGPIGAITGLAASAIDEYLIHEKKTDKHYLSLGAFWGSTTVAPIMQLLKNSLPGPYGNILSVGASVAGLALPYFVDDFLDFRNKLDVPMDSFNLINEMFDQNKTFSSQEAYEIYKLARENPYEAVLRVKKDALELYNNPFFMSFFKTTALNFANVCSSAFFTYLLATYSSNLFIANLLAEQPLLNQANLRQLSPYLFEALKILSLLFVKEQISYGIDRQLDSIATDQYEIVLEKSTELLIQNGNGRKIESFPRGKELIQNLTPDLTKLMYRGSNRLNQVLTEANKALISLGIISNLANSALATYAAFSMLYQWVVNRIASENKKLFHKHSEGEVHFWDVKFDISNNIEQINLRDGDDFVKHQYFSLLSKQNRLNKQMEMNTKLQGQAQKVTGIFRKAADAFYYGSLFAQKSIPLGKVPVLHSSVEDVYSFLDSNLHLEMNSNELLLAAKRLRRFFDLINTADQSKTKRTQNNEGKIILDNYTLFVLNNPILSLDHLEFKPGTRYAITGKSGCGKSAFLIDLKLGLLGAKSSEGEISLGCKKSEIMFIDQDLYFPQDSTLLETVYFPKTLDLLSSSEIEELRARIIELFKELEIDSHSEKGEESKGLISLLDQKDFELSGGQKKKVAVIQAILRKPKILLMDETFTGLDPRSLYLVEKAIIEKLPDTMILCIDHNAAANNMNTFTKKKNEPVLFYQRQIHFANGGVTEIEGIKEIQAH